MNSEAWMRLFTAVMSGVIITQGFYNEGALQAAGLAGGAILLATSVIGLHYAFKEAGEHDGAID